MVAKILPTLIRCLGAQGPGTRMRRTVTAPDRPWIAAARPLPRIARARPALWRHTLASLMLVNQGSAPEQLCGIADNGLWDVSSKGSPIGL